MGVAVSGSFGDLLTPGLRKIYSDQFKAMPEMRSLIFSVQSSKTSYEKDSSIGSFGDMQAFKGEISYDSVDQQYDVTYTHVELAKGFKVERKLMDDDLYGVISRRPQGLAISAARTFEKHGASVFNDAFSGSGTITLNGETVLSNSESLSLCNTSHTSTSNSAVQSNKGTSALSGPALETVRKAMAAFKDYNNQYISVQPDLLIVPRNLEEKAWTLIATKGIVDSADNNANFHFGRYKLAVWDFMDDTDNWFVVDSAMAKMFLNWFDRIPLEFFQDKSFDTLISKFANYARISYGWSDWRFIHGSQVS